MKLPKMDKLLSKTNDRWKYILFGIIMMLCLGTVYSWGIFRLSVEKEFQIGSTLSGIPYMASLAFYSLFMFLSGKYLTKYKPRSIVLFGTFLLAFGWIFSGLSNNIYVLTVTYGMIGGSGVGIIYGVPISLATKWFPDKKGLVIGFVVMGFGLSPMITAPLIQSLMDIHGLMKTFLILGVSFGIILPLLSSSFRYPLEVDLTDIPNDSVSDKAITTHKNMVEMIRTNSFTGLYLNFMIGTTIGLLVVGLTTKIGTEFVGIPYEKMPILMSLFALFNGAGRPIFGWLTDRFSPYKAILFSYTLLIFACILMLFPNSEKNLLFLVSFSLLWLNLGAWLSIAPTTTIIMFGTTNYTQNYGLVFTAYGFGAIIGVLSSGIILDIFQNFSYLFYFIVILCLIGIWVNVKTMRVKNKM